MNLDRKDSQHPLFVLNVFYAKIYYGYVSVELLTNYYDHQEKAYQKRCEDKFHR